MRCDRCVHWWRDAEGRPAYRGNRSQCTENGVNGMACSGGATLTTSWDFGCVRFVPVSGEAAADLVRDVSGVHVKVD